MAKHLSFHFEVDVLSAIAALPLDRLLIIRHFWLTLQDGLNNSLLVRFLQES